MFLMDDQVSDGKLRKILDPFSIVLFLLFPLFLFLAKNVRLCHHCELDQRILKSSSCMAIYNHDLTGIYLPVRILSVKSIQPFLGKVLCQTLCPCP